MSAADFVRDYRSRSIERTGRSWKKPVIAAGAAICVLAFGAIIVQANDAASVYEVNKAYNPARTAPRPVVLPQIFRSEQRPMVRTALSYAPVFGGLAPSNAQNDFNKRPVSGSPRTIKVAPSSKSKDFAQGSLDDSTSYCVRTCDGFFFPVGYPDRSDIAAHDEACARACPAAETAVFVAPSGSRGIEDAINRKGEKYETIRTAFAHRTQRDPACSCTGPGKARNYSVMSDFTLRKGDYVMGSDGLRMFRGEDSASHRLKDFTRADLSKLSAQERKTLEAMEAASARGAAVSPSLRARIAAQVNSQGPVAQRNPTSHRAALTGHKVKGSAGQDLRYVGPDLDFDRAR